MADKLTCPSCGYCGAEPFGNDPVQAMVPRSELIAERVNAERLTATIRDLARLNDDLRRQLRAAQGRSDG